jgi:hypothetical protein
MIVERKLLPGICPGTPDNPKSGVFGKRALLSHCFFIPAPAYAEPAEAHPEHATHEYIDRYSIPC